MAKRELTDEKINARRSYVELGITEFAELGKIHGVDRRTVAKWAEEERWEAQRAEVLVTPQEVSARVKRILSRLVSEIEQMQQAGKPVADSTIDRMIEYLDRVTKLDSTFDEAGSAIKFSEKFISFCRKHKKSKEIMPLLKEIVPEFVRDMARKE